MKTFDQRWLALTARARSAARTRGEDAAPDGLARRVLAASRRVDAAAGHEAEDLWLGWARWTLAVVAVVTLLLGGVEMASRRSHRPMAGPAVENAVAELIWRL